MSKDAGPHKTLNLKVKTLNPQHAKGLSLNPHDPQPQEFTERSIWDFPKIRGTILGVSIIRTIVFWGLYWGPPIINILQGPESSRSFGSRGSTWRHLVTIYNNWGNPYKPI